MDAENPHDKQGDFFNRARRETSPVTIYLTNGKKLTGRIRSFDRFTVVLESNRHEQLIFKHAISTVAIGRAGPPGGGRPASARRPGPGGPAARSSSPGGTAEEE